MKILYENKEALQNDESLPDKNKVTAEDMNEIKEVVNYNSEDLTKQIIELKEENTALKDLFPQGQSSGENITLNDSADYKFKSFEVRGNSKQEKREGYNLVNIDNVETHNTSVIEKNDNYIVVENTEKALNVFYINNIVLKAGITYTINRLYKVLSGTETIQTGAVELYIGNSWIKVLLEKNKNTNTFTVDEDGTYRIRCALSTSTTEVLTETLQVKFSNLMIYEGTEEKEYEQYGAMPSLDYKSDVKSCGDNGSITIVKSNKNLFDKNNTINECYYDITTKKIGHSLNWRIANIKAKSNTNYCISGNNINNTTAGFVELDKDLNIIKVIGNYKDTNQFTTTKDCIYIGLSIPAYLDNIGNDLDTFMLEEGPIATDYVEHQSQEYIIPTQKPMRAIGDVRDRFVKQNSVWYEEHNIKRIILDGTEEYTAELSDEFTRFNLSILDVLNISARNENCASNYFKTSTVNGYEIIMLYQTRLIFYPTKDITTLADWKAKLTELYNAGTPLYVDYVLSTPELIECTEEQSKILDELQNAKTYKTVTNIYSTDEVSPVLNVVYFKDLETLIAGGV